MAEQSAVQMKLHQVLNGRVVLGSYFQRSGSAQRSISVIVMVRARVSALTSAQRSIVLKMEICIVFSTLLQHQTCDVKFTPKWRVTCDV